MAQSPIHELLALVTRRRSGQDGGGSSPHAERVFWQEFWVLLFIALLATGLISGKGVLVAFGATGMLAMAVSWLWNSVALSEVTLERHLSQTHTFAGEEIRMVLSVTNGKPVPLGWLHIQDRLPLDVSVVDARSNVRQEGTYQVLEQSTAISWYEKVSWAYSIKSDRRGYYRFGPATLDSGDIFGFYRKRMVSERADRLIVYPKVVPLSDLGIPSFHALGDSRSYVPLHEDLSLPSTIREYRRGDPLNRVAWKESAKAQDLRVRTFDPSASVTVMLAVCVETTSRRWEGFIPELLERTVTASASIAAYAFERRHAVGLISNGSIIESTRSMRLDPSRSPSQLSQIMEALATIQPVLLRPMARFLEEEARSFPNGSTVVVAAAFMPPELVDSIRSMRRTGHPVLVVYAGDEQPPELPEDVVVHNVGAYLGRMERDIDFRPT